MKNFNLLEIFCLAILLKENILYKWLGISKMFWNSLQIPHTEYKSCVKQFEKKMWWLYIK